MKTIENGSAIAAPDQLSARFRKAIGLLLVSASIFLAIPTSLAAMSNALKRDKSLGADMKKTVENIEDIKALQAALQQLGFYDGEIAGDYDEQTVAAVRELQALLQSINPAYLNEINGNFDTATRLAIFKFQMENVYKNAPQYGKMNGTGWLGDKTIDTLKPFLKADFQSGQAADQTTAPPESSEQRVEHYGPDQFKGFYFGEGEDSPWDFVLGKYEYYNEEEIPSSQYDKLAKEIKKSYRDYINHVTKRAYDNAAQDNQALHDALNALAKIKYEYINDILWSFEEFCKRCPNIASKTGLNENEFKRSIKEIDKTLLEVTKTALERILKDYEKQERSGILRARKDRDQTAIVVVGTACIVTKLIPSNSGNFSRLFYDHSSGDKLSWQMEEAANALGQSDGYFGPDGIKALLIVVETELDKLENKK